MSNDMLTLHPKEGIELLAVEVPEDAKEFEFENLGKEIGLFYKSVLPPFGYITHFKPVPGNYSFVTTTQIVTEVKVRGIVQMAVGQGKPRYRIYGCEPKTPFVYEWKDSLFSLIRSAGGDPDKHTYAILKKQ